LTLSESAENNYVADPHYRIPALPLQAGCNKTILRVALLKICVIVNIKVRGNATCESK